MSLRSTLFRVSAFFVFFDFEADFDPDFGVDFEPHSVVDFDLAFSVKLSFFLFSWLHFFFMPEQFDQIPNELRSMRNPLLESRHERSQFLLKLHSSGALISSVQSSGASR